MVWATLPDRPLASSSEREARNIACGVRNWMSIWPALREPRPGIRRRASQCSSSSLVNAGANYYLVLRTSLSSLADTLYGMDQQATYDDVKLVLQLYEMRREEKLREARKWFAKFNARTWAEKNELCPPGSDQDAFFRMVVTYWEMVASFITAGVLHQELFLQSGQ